MPAKVINFSEFCKWLDIQLLTEICIIQKFLYGTFFECISFHKSQAFPLLVDKKTAVILKDRLLTCDLPSFSTR